MKLAKKQRYAPETEEHMEDVNAMTKAKALGLGYGAMKGTQIARAVGVMPWAKDFMNNPMGTEEHIRQMAATRPGVEVIRDYQKTPSMADHKWFRDRPEEFRDAMREQRMGSHGPHYMPKRTAEAFGRENPYVYLGQNTRVGIAAHEFGHAKDPSKLMKFNRDYLMAPSNIAQKVTVPGAFALAFSKDKKKRRLGVALPWLAAAPLLAEEGRANIHGWRSLNRLGLDKKTLRGARGDLAKSYAAYLAMPAAVSLGSYSTGKYLTKRRERKAEEEEKKKKKSLRP